MADKKPQIKCTRKSWCVRMEERLAPEANARVKGLVELVVTNFKTGKSNRYGVFYRTDPGDPGLMLNFCPWCGTAIDWKFKDK